MSKTLGKGRFLIGHSAFAAIRIPSSGQGIGAMLMATEESVTVKCLAANPTVYADGRRLQTGEQITIGDFLELIVDRTPITISAKSLIWKTPSNERSKTSQKTKNDKTLTPLQARIDLECPSRDSLVHLVARELLSQLDLDAVDLTRVDSEESRESAKLKLRKILADLKTPKHVDLTRSELEKRVFDEVLGLGPLEPLLGDDGVTEIMVNRRDQIFVEKSGKIQQSSVHFSSDQALLNTIERIVSTVGRRIDASSPIVDARLADGSRVNAVIPPLAIRGPSLTIRRFSSTPIRVDQLVEWGSLSNEIAAFLESSVQEHKNLIVSGGTGSGKTTLLNALSSFIPTSERIITVEDAAELQLQQDHVVSLESRPANLEGAGGIAIRDLVKNTLRMRPDRIIVGECRGAEALDMLQAMNTGHDGSMTTAHANSPTDMLRRLETMVMMAGMDLPLRAIREQVASALTLIVQQSRLRTGKRLVTEVSWIRGLCPDSGSYLVTPLFFRDQDSPSSGIGLRSRNSVELKMFPSHWKTCQEVFMSSLSLGAIFADSLMAVAFASLAFAGRRYIAEFISGFWSKDNHRKQQSRLVMIGLSVGLLSFGVFFSIGLPTLLCSMVGVGVGVAVPRIVKQRQLRRFKDAFDSSLPESLTAISSSLKAGLTLPDSLALATRTCPTVFSHETSRALKEYRFGVSIEEALDNLRTRIQTPTSNIAMGSLIIGSQLGGNLPAILSKIASTVREREKVEGKLRALTAQGRAQSFLVCAAPPLIGFGMYLYDPQRVSYLTNTFAGQFLLVLAITLEIIGIIVTRRVMALEV